MVLLTANGGFDVYDIPDATNPEPFKNASAFFNDDSTRAALHAPTSKNWIRNFNYPFGSVYNTTGNQYGDPSLEPIAFLSDLATNASAANVSIVFYSGNDDALVQHRGTEVIIQNMTFGGTQGFTRRPATIWFDDDGQVARIVHQERGLRYVTRYTSCAMHCNRADSVWSAPSHLSPLRVMYKKYSTVRPRYWFAF